MGSEGAHVWTRDGGTAGTGVWSVDSGALRRGSLDDAAVSLRPNFRHLAQRRQSAPSLVFGRGLGMPWSPIREESSCWAAADQCPFVLGLCGDNGDLLLDQKVRVTEGSRTEERHIFLFREVLVFAKLKSAASFRLKHRVQLSEAFVFSFDSNPEDEAPELDLALSLLLAWDLSLVLLTFSSPNEKERWLNILHRVISEAKGRDGGDHTPSDELMKVLTASVAVKGGMEHLIELPVNGTACVPLQQFSSSMTAAVEENTSSAEKRWRGVVRRLRRGSSFVNRTSRPDPKKVLFGKPLSSVCSEDGALPKAVLELLTLLRKHGPSTEGVFRKSCNNKRMLELREQLDSGTEVQLEEQPVVLLVGLLKSFLKEIPGSLLDTQLYDKWTVCLEEEDPQRRAEAVHRVLEELPGPNVLLLQHLLCVLHHIREESPANMMDARNLALCIGPTLLHREDTPLDEQPDRMKTGADLTEFLIEHWGILGENIPSLLDTDEDSVSTQHHDSAYDSTDPDGEAEQADGGTRSAESLTQEPPSVRSKAAFARRCSEPIICFSADLHGLRCHARSHDDCSVSAHALAEQPLKKQISDDAILSRRSAPPFPQSYTDTERSRRDCSCSSIDSVTSNQSESSVFTSSPVASPTCPRKTSSAQSTHEKEDVKRRPQAVKVLLRARSFNRIGLKRADPQSEPLFPCGTLQEDSQSEDASPKPRPLSAVEVFRYMDSRLPCEPPSYEQAVQATRPLPAYSVMTVQDALRLDRRARPASVHYDWPTRSRAGPGVERQRADSRRGLERGEKGAFRPRAMSESLSAGAYEASGERCNQPVFEEFSYAKESYV